jgi:arsenate reductase
MGLTDFDDELLLLHNPRCSKSRSALALLEERGVAFRERRYLEDPLDRDELADLRERLGRPVAEWARTSEEPFGASGLSPEATDDELVALIADHPIVLERPIAVRGKRAVVGRPPENVLDLL